PFVLPLMFAIAVLIKLDGGSVIFRQRRVGLGGREFDFLKFRSMIPDADCFLEKHLSKNPAAAAEWETKQKLDKDPRVTKLGRFIRTT
ncbi:sugar transferase, partial [Vibrio diabolicus]|uniref:sugar transferase n=1 Tax=Vibrio diabolicus TaxID=50719 RepID=UPI002495879C